MRYFEVLDFWCSSKKQSDKNLITYPLKKILYATYNASYIIKHLKNSLVEDLAKPSVVQFRCI